MLFKFDSSNRKRFVFFALSVLAGLLDYLICDFVAWINHLPLFRNLGVVVSVLDALFHKCDSFFVSCISSFGHTAASCVTFQFLMTIIQLYPVS